MPDRASGRTTAVVAPSGRRPSARAASSSRGLTLSSDARVDASPYGMKRITYATRNRARLWYRGEPIRAPTNTSASATAIPGSALGRSVSRSSQREIADGYRHARSAAGSTTRAATAAAAVDTQAELTAADQAIAARPVTGSALIDHQTRTPTGRTRKNPTTRAQKASAASASVRAARPDDTDPPRAYCDRWPRAAASAKRRARSRSRARRGRGRGSRPIRGRAATRTARRSPVVSVA